MSLGSRVARLEAKHLAEFSAMLEDMSTWSDAEVEEFVKLATPREAREILERLSDAQLAQLAAGDSSFLTPEEYRILDFPIRVGALEFAKEARGSLAASLPTDALSG